MPCYYCLVLCQIAIVTPVHNDWAAARKLVSAVDPALASVACDARVLLIDDACAGSADGREIGWLIWSWP